jgi:hypothetical protein
MKRKYLLLIVGTTATLVGLALGALAMSSERSGVTKANFDRIKKGMTRAEVESILAEPLRKPDRVYRTSPTLLTSSGIWCQVAWHGPDGACAEFSFHNDVVYSDDKKWTPSTETVGEKLRRWLRSCIPDTR